MTDNTRDERVEALFAEIPPPGIYGPRTPTAYERKLAERLALAEQERDAACDEIERLSLMTVFRSTPLDAETVEERPDGAVVYRKRCPHDGGACHHECGAWECFRESGGMALSEPHKGYPLPGHDALRARVDRLEVAVAGHLARTNPGGYAGDWAVRELLAKEEIARDVAKREAGDGE